MDKVTKVFLFLGSLVFLGVPIWAMRQVIAANAIITAGDQLQRFSRAALAAVLFEQTLVLVLSLMLIGVGGVLAALFVDACLSKKKAQ